MSAYTASLGQTKTCFAAAKSAAPGSVARKVGQVVTKITVVTQPAASHLPPRMLISHPPRLQAVAFRAPFLGDQRAEAPSQECLRDARRCSASLRGETLS